MENNRNYTINETGLNLPIEFFERYGLGSGDDVTIVETDKGLVVLPRVATAMALLDQIGTDLKAKGITLDDLLESGREIRGNILREKYGIDSDTDE